jgi:hypothetical protein
MLMEYFVLGFLFLAAMQGVLLLICTLGACLPTGKKKK